MALGHEKLDVYRLSIGYVAWVYEKADSLNSTGWPRCSAVSAEEVTKFERIKRPTASISIAISIPKKENPNVNFVVQLPEVDYHEEHEDICTE